MYVPMLRWKQGEQWACKGLADEVAESTYPLIEVPPRPVDAKTKAPKKSVEAYLDSIAKSIAASWKGHRRFALDLTFLEESIDGASAGRGIENLFKQLRRDGYRPVAVARSDHRPSQLLTVKRAAALGGEGLLIRCIWEDVSQGTLNETLDYLLGELEVDATATDLVLDLRAVTSDNFSGLEERVPAALRALRHAKSWQSITLAGGAFPRNLTGMKPGRRVISRLDWKLYGSIAGAERKLGRSLWFGDYGIGNWELPDIDVTKMQMSANLRYTSDNDWIVYRGRSVNSDGYGQYVDLCELLVSDAVYCGEEYSMGDKNYTETTRTKKPGNASCWRRDATNHHITLAVRQLATLGAL